MFGAKYFLEATIEKTGKKNLTQHITNTNIFLKAVDVS